MVLVFGTVILGTVCIVGVVQEDKRRSRLAEKPCLATFRTLDADPDLYTGRNVKVSTDGSQPGATANELVFRKRADLEPVVVLIFTKAVDVKTPKFAIGVCAGRIGNAVRVKDCVPADD